MLISKQKAGEVVLLVERYGTYDAAKHLNLSVETLNRYLREAKFRYKLEPNKKSIWVNKILESYSDDEIKAIAKGGRLMPGMAKVPIINFTGKRIRIGAITDTHIGHKRFSASRLEQVFEEFKKERVDFITHSGDVTQGMNTRQPGMIYELDQLGYDRQKDEAVRLFSQWTDTDIYAIDGNHDRWFLKSNGAVIVKDISSRIKNFHWIGHDEGDISLKGKATLRLFHGEDGASYALSYRIQKILESFSPGEKPDAIFLGHDHKHVKLFERGVHAVGMGTLQQQTQWMRGKRIAAHVGFCIVDFWINNKGICKMTETWYPFYT